MSSSPAAVPRPTPVSPTPVWRARLLGTIELSGEGVALRHFGGRNVEALFARLALRPGEAVAREVLAELLWPGTAGDVARNRLRNTLAGLRDALRAVGAEGLLDAGRATLRLSSVALSSDVQQLEALVREPWPVAPTTALTGELMPGHSADWVQDERLRLAALADRLNDRVRDAAGAAPGQAADRVDGVAATDAGTARAAQAPLRLKPRPLPTPISRFFGRNAEHEGLLQALLLHRLVTVCGHGGCGKSRLALEVARSRRLPWPVAWVPLADCGDLRQIPEQVLAALQAPATQVVMQSAAQLGLLAPVIAALGEQPLLLVLDNVEQFEPAALSALLSSWLEQAGGLRLLLTSRRPQQLAGEEVLWLAPLPLPLPGTPALDSPAVQLFLDRGRAARADAFGNGTELDPQALVEVVRVCEALDGTPLAIELAAARLLGFSPAELRAALHDGGAGVLLRLPVPAEGAGPAAARHASIDATLSWSMALLPEPARRLLCALSVFAGGFSAASAAAVCGQSASAEVRALLASLVTQSLLLRDGTAAGSARFRLLHLVAEFARQQLPEAERLALRGRHRRAFLATALGTPRAEADRLAPDDANLRAAIASALADGQPADAVALGAALAPYFERLGIAPATLEQLGAAAQATTADTPHHQALLLALADLLLNGAGRPEAAARLAEQALAQARGARERALALYMKARIGWARTLDASGLRPMLEEAVALARQAGDAEAEARALWILGPVLRRLDRDPVAAEAAYVRAGALFEQAGDPIMANRMVYLRANCAMQRGEHERALALHRVCAERCRALDDRIGLMRQRNEEGVALLALQRWADAGRVFGDSVTLAWHHHHLYLLLFGLFNLPQAAVRLGHAAEACRLSAFAAARWPRHVGPMNPTIAAEARLVPELARAELGDAAVQVLQVEGEALSLPDAVALALSLASSPAIASPTPAQAETAAAP